MQGCERCPASGRESAPPNVRFVPRYVTDAELPRQSIVGGASIYPFVQNLSRAPSSREKCV